jgi:hypothetical protein
MIRRKDNWPLILVVGAGFLALACLYLIIVALEATRG